MSPTVRLVCDPDGNGAFAEHTALTLRIDLPGASSADEVIGEIQLRVREIYPLATITVEDSEGEDALPIWHVRRDGHLPEEHPLS